MQPVHLVIFVAQMTQVDLIVCQSLVEASVRCPSRPVCLRRSQVDVTKFDSFRYVKSDRSKDDRKKRRERKKKLLKVNFFELCRVNVDGLMAFVQTTVV